MVIEAAGTVALLVSVACLVLVLKLRSEVDSMYNLLSMVESQVDVLSEEAHKEWN